MLPSIVFMLAVLVSAWTVYHMLADFARKNAGNQALIGMSISAVLWGIYHYLMH